MDKRDEISEKALELFIAQGYDATPLSHIAKALGLTKAGIYHYFKSKEELLFYIHDRNMKRDLIPIIEGAEKIKDPVKRISYMIENYTEKSMTIDSSARVLVHEVGRLKYNHQKIIRKSWRKFFYLIRNAISELQSSGKARKIDETFAAFALIGMCSWTFYWFDHERKESAKKLSETYVNIFLKGIMKD